MRRIAFALIIGLSFTGVASAQDDPAPPCGPAGHLPSRALRQRRGRLPVLRDSYVHRRAGDGR